MPNRSASPHPYQADAKGSAMARPSKSGKVLTWHKPSKRWKKVISGKAVYFGSGNYSEALDRYNAYLEEQRRIQRRDNAAATIASANARLQALTTDDSLPQGERSPAELLAELLNSEHPAVRRMLQSSIAQATTDISDAATDLADAEQTSENQPEKSQVETLADAYVQEQRQRHALTKKQPEALPPKRRLNVQSLRSIRETIEAFKQWAKSKGRVKTFGDTQQTERIIKRYRQHLEQQITDGKIATATASNRLRRIKPFINWLWHNRYIDDYPRNADEALTPFASEPKAKAINPDDIRTLFNAADDRMKALIAVCLNCGMYVKEAASIKLKDYDGEYIAKRRGKTGVPAKYKLWDTTKRLIDKTKTAKKQNDYLWTTNRGYPLVHDTPNASSNSVATPWRDLCNKTGVKAQWANLRDTAATEIERIGKRQGNATLVSQFLAHADGRTARFYIDDSGSPFDLETPTLDNAIIAMGKHFNLKA